MKGSFNSRLLDSAVEHISRLPGIGHKTALRLSLHLLRQDPEVAHALAESIVKMRDELGYCERCHNISEQPLCEICSDPRREQSQICVVENIKDVLAIESTREFKGLYHVLGGLVSPADGIGPSDIEIDSLVERVRTENTKEVILALSPTMEGDTTAFYIFRRLADTDAEVSVLARGISVGGDIEYTDEVTLGRSIINRIPFDDK